MAAIKTFATRATAKAEIEKIRSWDATVVQMIMPLDENTDESGNVFVIECQVGNSDPLYMREDWYVA